jgi:hypothetical protein
MKRFSLVIFCIYPCVLLAIERSMLQEIVMFSLPFLEIIGILALIGTIYYFLTAKMTPENASKRAEKLLGKHY